MDTDIEVFKSSAVHFRQEITNQVQETKFFVNLGFVLLWMVINKRDCREYLCLLCCDCTQRVGLVLSRVSNGVMWQVVSNIKAIAKKKSESFL